MGKAYKNFSVFEYAKKFKNNKNINLPDLILHVGPGKCGSSSIQNFFETEINPCAEKINYKFLSPSNISEINCDEPDNHLLDEFSQLISENFNNYDTRILSHEFLFQNPYAIKNICSITNDLNLKVAIVGYCRRQSDFLRSAYSQWLFRSQDRVTEVIDTVKEFGLDPLLFTGLENQFIASVINDFYSARQLTDYSILDWYHSYKNISKLIQESGAEIKCSTLPGRSSKVPLIEDFCNKSGLTLNNKSENSLNKITNISFNHGVVEAINNAVSHGIGIVGPHEDNNIIELLSSKMETGDKTTSGFMSDLKSYVDSFYWESNKKLCKKYDLDEKCFKPSKELNKKEILEIILNEGQNRFLNKSDIIENYRKLCARMVELCFKLAKND